MESEKEQVNTLQEAVQQKLDELQHFENTSLSQLEDFLHSVQDVIQEKYSQLSQRIIQQCEKERNFLNSSLYNNDEIEIEEITQRKYTFKAKPFTGDAFSKCISSLIAPAPNSSNTIYHFNFREDTIEQVNIETHQLKVINPPMTSPIGASIAILNNNQLIIAGGILFANFMAQDRVVLYDIEQNTTRDLARMLTARGYCAYQLIDNFFYVFGGSNSDQINAVAYSSNERYDILSDSWVQIAPMNFERSAFTSAQFNRVIYIIGGWSTVSQIERYNPDTDTCSILEVQLNSPGSSSCYMMGDQLLIFHGRNLSRLDMNDETLEEVETEVTGIGNWGLYSYFQPKLYENRIYFIRAWQNQWCYYDIEQSQVIEYTPISEVPEEATEQLNQQCQLVYYIISTFDHFGTAH